MRKILFVFALVALAFMVVCPEAVCGQSRRIYGTIKDNTGQTMEGTVTAYGEGTGDVVATSQTSNGYYEIQLEEGKYDVVYTIPDFFIPDYYVKIFSVDVGSDVHDLLSDITGYPSEDRVVFNVDSSDNQTIQTYSWSKPNNVFIDGVPAGEVFQFNQLTNYTWFFAEAAKRLNMKTGMSVQIPSGLPWLHVDGKYIKDENGDIAELKGTSWLELEWRTTLEDSLEQRIGRMKRYGVKVVRLHLSSYWWQQQSYKNLIDTIVERLGEEGIYVIISWSTPERNRKPDFTDADIVNLLYNPDSWYSWWEEVATRYKDDSNVIISLWNELFLGGGNKEGYTMEQLINQWRIISLECADRIHAIQPKHLILIAPIIPNEYKWTWGSYAVTEPNVVFTTHVYYSFSKWMDWGSDYNNGNFESAKQEFEQYVINNYVNTGKAVFFEEIGANTDDANWAVQIEDMYDILDKYNIPWVQHVWRTSPPNTMGLVCEDWVTTSSVGGLWTAQLSGNRESPMAVGVNKWYGTSNTEIYQRDLPAMEELGISHVRYGSPTYDNLESYERTVDILVANEIEVVGTLGTDSLAGDIDAFGDYVEYMVNHFKGRINYWVVWNEPNWGAFTNNPAGYTAFLKEAYARAKQVDPNVKIITGNFLSTEGGITFLEGIYANGGKGYFDIVSIDPYVEGAGPLEPETDLWGHTFWNLPEFRQIMVDNGDEDMKVWIVEFGYTTDPNDVRPSTEEDQARYIGQALELANSWDWVERFYIYQLMDAADEWCCFGLIREDYSPPFDMPHKPAFYAVKEFIQSN